jgi:type IV pilus assembly protein PilO
MKRSDFEFRNLDFQNPGGWPKGVKLVFCMLLFIVLAAAGWWFKIRDQQDELDRAEQKEVALKSEFSTKQAKAVNLPALKQQLEEMKDMLRQMLRQLPSKTEMPELLVDISQTALSSGIENELFQPGTEAVKEFYAERPISLRMVGTYHQFGSFISGVASLPRVVILTMHDVSLRPTAGDKPGQNGILMLEGTVKTYRYVEDDETPSSAPAAPAKGGK